MTPLEDIKLDNVGLEATFECEVTRTDMKAEWLKAGKPIKATADKYKMTSKNGKHSLTISDCQAEDVAKYTVKLNGISSSAKLDVIGTRSRHYTVTLLHCLFRWYVFRRSYIRVELVI